MTSRKQIQKACNNTGLAINNLVYNKATKWNINLTHETRGATFIGSLDFVLGKIAWFNGFCASAETI